MAFMLKHEETIARLDKEIRDLTEKVERLGRGTEHLADKVSKCITIVADADLRKPGNKVPADKPAPAPKKAKKSAKHNKTYTADEIALALMLREQGATYRQIGTALGAPAPSSAL
jgi:L-lactate utilization protein LutB